MAPQITSVKPPDTKAIQRITWVGMVANLVLSGFKLLAGYLTGSVGLIADGFHSVSDLSTDVAVLVGTGFAGKPPDRNHPFGHGKFETFATTFVALVLAVGGVWILKASVSIIKEPLEYLSGWEVVTVAALAIAAKEWLFRATKQVALTTRSTAVFANAWHHRSDALSSVVVFAGGIAALAGFRQGDAVAGIIVGFMVAAVGAKLGMGALMELSEASAGVEQEALIEDCISGFPEVRGWHKMRVRRMGRQLFMDIHIILDAELTVVAAHDIVRRIEEMVKSRMDLPINLLIHIDPDTLEIRAARKAVGDPTLR